MLYILKPDFAQHSIVYTTQKR